MVKLIGAAMILFASTWIGFELAGRFGKRTRLLREMKVAMQSLEAEIVFSQKPLKAAAADLSEQLEKPLSQFFSQFSHILSRGGIDTKAAWKESLDQLAAASTLQKGELEVMKQFGETLGKHDLISQQKHIRLAMVHLEREEAEAGEKQNRYERMIKSIGFLSGLLLVIVLL
ncbi:stage III sporulation protein SpoAB [Bacillus sp. FJAT-42376]|uniref:stage III sporulation protein SpoIIIAB n=1 Tax=Bacillus sp. FJAT-42376 TaxID=2014076 RepID=UPI000F515680|nr:stage III sporulation protein SpoIIIAB [Bacillus sp. FJAT-42376]AZB43538.1 stage III sporulation protein SpoAB [Bacillus sp. FJAT-42376]